jgi:hypothetical protein
MLYLWPLGCLTALGAITAAFWLEEALYALCRTLTKGLAAWR